MTSDASFLPLSGAEAAARGWDAVDVVLVSKLLLTDFSYP